MVGATEKVIKNKKNISKGIKYLKYFPTYKKKFTHQGSQEMHLILFMHLIYAQKHTYRVYFSGS